MPRGGFCFGAGERQFGCGKSMPLPRRGEAKPGPPHAVPRLVRPASCGGPGKTGERAALPHWAEAEPGFPHVVRIRTDIFLRRGKCPRCRVRWGETGRSTFRQTNLLLARAARGPGSFARGGRATVRRRTRRFGHAALAPCSVFAPRRTTRRQCRGFLDFQRAADREKRGGAPPWCRSAPRSGRSGLYPSCPPPGAAGASRRARQRLRLPKMGTHSKNHRLE